MAFLGAGFSIGYNGFLGHMLLQHMPSFGSWRVPGNRQMSKLLTVQPLPQHLQKSAKISKLAPCTVRPSREGNRDATRALDQPLQLLHPLLLPQRSMSPLSLEELLRVRPTTGTQQSHSKSRFLEAHGGIKDLSRFNLSGDDGDTAKKKARK